MPHISVGNDLPGIIGLMRFRPETGVPLSALAEVLLHDPDNSLSPGEREAMRDLTMWPVTSDPAEHDRRSIYLFVDRYEQPTVPATFDFANPDRHSPQRFVTVVIPVLNEEKYSSSRDIQELYKL